MTGSQETGNIDRADLLVGRFFRLFGAIEDVLDEAIRKLFELTPDNADVVCANIDFFRKLSIVRSSLSDQDKDGQHAAQIKALFKRIAEANDKRQIAAHASFESNGDDGVIFYRVVARTGLQRSRPVWTESDCEKIFAELDAIRSELRTLTRNIAPYHPSLDFSDPRNSMYIAFFW
jgi:hypothetical protein